MAIAPKERIGELLIGRKVEKIYNVLPSKSETEVYSIAFEKETKLYILNIKVTRDTTKALHYYNKNTII